MFFRIALCDPISGNELEFLGFFSACYAASFRREWMQSATDDPDEFRVLVLTPVSIEVFQFG